MSSHDPVLIKKVKQWLTHAEEDLALAQYGLTMSSSCPYRLIAYHAQQCAEKYLKAFLVYHNIDFPYTHNIRNLLKLCSQQGAWANDLQNVKELTTYATLTRYPGDDEVIKTEATHAIDLAISVKNAVITELKANGLQF